MKTIPHKQQSNYRACTLSMADKVDLMAARLERSWGWIIKQALSAWFCSGGGA